MVADSGGPILVLENRHTGERLTLRRVTLDGQACLELKGSLPPHREGPPLHIHFLEDEEGHVRSGTLSAEIGGQLLAIGPGKSVRIPRGVAHRWWNAGDDPLVFEGYARPAVDLDRYLEAIFQVMNAGPPGRPPIFYMAHVALRHRRTQAVLLIPRPTQWVLFRLLVAAGTVLGKYRGDDWPGCPARCPGVQDESGVRVEGGAR